MTVTTAARGAEQFKRVVRVGKKGMTEGERQRMAEGRKMERARVLLTLVVAMSCVLDKNLREKGFLWAHTPGRSVQHSWGKHGGR